MTAKRTAFTREQEPAAMHSSMNVYLDVGITWIIVIDTNLYSGNFENEIAAYVAGVTDGGRGSENALEARKENRQIVDSLRNKAIKVVHDEYGHVYAAIRATPGRGNDGMGGHFDRTYKDGEKGYAAYESVAMFFDKPLTAEEMTFIKDRADSFAKTHQERHPTLKVQNVQMIECELAPAAERLVIPTE